VARPDDAARGLAEDLPDAKRIKDPVHDFIVVQSHARALLDEPLVQRLRFVRQTGTAHLVYPGANHTRFEHSLGCHHLATTAASALDLDEATARDLGAAALLHDVGHSPFSHTSEAVVERSTGLEHEELSVRRIREHLEDTLLDHDLDPDRVEALVLGEHRLSGLISGPLDVDRIDYLLRDGHYTGVSTSVDALRLMMTVTEHDGRVVATPDGLNAAEGLLVTRFAMHSAVYYHHTCRAGELLLERAMLELVEGGRLGGHELARMDDYDLVARLRQAEGTAGDLAQRVFERRLPKVALEVPYKALEDRWVEAYAGDLDRHRQLEREIADEAGVPAHHVHVDAPSPPTLPEVDAPILDGGGEVRGLAEASTLVRSLASAHQDHWHFRVYAPPGSLGVVEEAAPRAVALERSLDEFA
jgi:HD superfamily phosphohydrolase